MRATQFQIKKRRVAVLGYHKIGPPPSGGWESWYYVSERLFVQQLQWLTRTGWQFINLAAFLDGLAAPQTLPERSALITFDDGYRSHREVALPILRRLDLPAVLFVPTHFVGRSNEFDDGIEPVEQMCDWDDLRELERNGVSIESHAHTHRTFSMMNAADQRAELTESKAVLEKELCKVVRAFSFPYGDEGVEGQHLHNMLREAGYQAAFLYGGGPVLFPMQHPFRLTRLAMGPDTNLVLELEDGEGVGA